MEQGPVEPASKQNVEDELEPVDHSAENKSTSEQEMDPEEVSQEVISYLRENRENYAELDDESFEELIGGFEVLNEHGVDINDAVGEAYGLLEQYGLDPVEILTSLGLMQ